MSRVAPLSFAAVLVAAACLLAGDLEEEYDLTSRRAAPRDGFPVLNDPTMTKAADAEGIRDDEPVIGVAVGEDAQAFPISVMGRHELANVTCGKSPLAVSW